MRIYIDRDSGSLINGFSFPEAVNGPAGTNSIGAKRGDTPSIDAQFGRKYGLAQEIDAALAITTFRFGAKAHGDFAGDYVVSNWDGAAFAYTKLSPSFTDAVLNSTATLTSATAGFTQDDVGLGISGAGIPSGAKINAVVSASTITLSAAATATATDVSILIAGRATYSVAPSFNVDELNDLFITAGVSQVVANQAARYALVGLTLNTVVRQQDTHAYWKVIDPAHLGDSAGWSTDVAEKDYVDLDAEIEVTQGTQITSSLTFTLRVYNDVNKGAEGVPAAANPAYPLPSEIELIARKDASNGYAGLTLFKINFKNALNTFTSFLTNANTAARTYLFPDRDGTIADNTDITNAKARANHTGTQTLATISDAGTAAAAALDTDVTLAADSDTRIPSQKAVKAFVATNVTGLLDFKGNIDCSANPNYPAGAKGDAYYVSVAGKIGGGAGKDVAVGDAVICKADNAGGDEATVGTSWFILEKGNPGISDIAGLQAALDGKAKIGYTLKSANYTAVAGDKLLADTSTAAFTITLPSAPSVGYTVEIGDAQGSFATNNLTVGRNGQSIDGNAGNLICDVGGAQLTLAFSGGAKGWAVYGR